MRRTTAAAALLFLGLLLLPAERLETAVQHESLFRVGGDGQLVLSDPRTQERIAVVYRDRQGSYDDAALAAIDRTLRCHGRDEVFPISLKLIELVDHLQDHFGAEEIRVISGYRSPEYNAQLRRRSRRVAHDSLHMKGMAMDIRMPGVSKFKIGRYAREIAIGGVGVYPRSGFVHVDVGPVRTW